MLTVEYWEFKAVWFWTGCLTTLCLMFLLLLLPKKMIRIIVPTSLSHRETRVMGRVVRMVLSTWRCPNRHPQWLALILKNHLSQVTLLFFHLFNQIRWFVLASAPKMFRMRTLPQRENFVFLFHSISPIPAFSSALSIHSSTIMWNNLVSAQRQMGLEGK